MNMDPWDFEFKGNLPRDEEAKQLKQSRSGYTTDEGHRHFFVNDLEHPYNETKRFDWLRGYHVGGRSLVWGRHSYRWSDIDFEANRKENIAVDWPVRYKDIEPWYEKVEKFIGVSGEALGLPQLPDSKFCPPIEMNCVENDLKENMANNYDDGRVLTVGRIAHITGTQEFEGRAACQFRNRCMRGCPFGGYFSSNSSTLPAAERTGNLTIRPFSVVSQVIYDETTGKASGVEIIDAETNEKMVFNSKVVFLCASAIASASILLQSKSERFPNGLGNDSGEVGHNIMDHHFKAGAWATVNDFEDKYYKGRRPGGIYLPRFRNLGEGTDQKNYLRGYGYQGGASRSHYDELVAELAYGKNLKESITKPGKWRMLLLGFGECLPYHENKMTLDYDRLDGWGLPTVTFDAEWKENEYEMRKDMVSQAVEMLEKAGYDDIEPWDDPGAPGLGIHEMGTARMGKDPKTSVCNGNNQVHTVPNVYMTDGAFMTSASCVNPSLTYMAFSARAANHAAEQIKKERNG
jgi:choline dehydrogenase-like flavoprotein